jgi:hypothetical protein
MKTSMTHPMPSKSKADAAVNAKQKTAGGTLRRRLYAVDCLLFVVLFIR